MNFSELYNKQIAYQNKIKDGYDFEVKELPTDDVRGMSYNINHLLSELGEVLAADKRWKSCRNTKLDVEEKKEELADCFIVLMNMAIFSNITGEELEKLISDKIDKNFRR